MKECYCNIHGTDILYYHISETLNIHSDLSTVLDSGNMAMNNTDGFSTLMEMTLKRDRQEKNVSSVE